MIKKRPWEHFKQTDYELLVPGPYALALDQIPDLIKLSLLVIDGVQPLTSGRSKAAGGLTSSHLSEAEIAYYQERDAKFQLIMIVINCVRIGEDKGHPRLLPYSMTLLPSSKRGRVTESRIDFVSHFSGMELMGGDTAYVGFDPFVGDWQVWGNVGVIIGGSPRPGFMDELGLVYGHYFLEISHEPDEVAHFFPDIPENVRKRYARHTSKLLFRPFSEPRARRIWGLETPLELFTLQEILYQDLPIPQPQVMIMGNGDNFPCLYDAWTFFSKEGAGDLITEVDFLFPEHRVALFCDGAQHSRQRNRERDNNIDQKLRALDYRPLRLSSKRILSNVSEAVGELKGVLSE